MESEGKIDKESQLGELIKRRRIKLALFDLDDNLIITNPIFTGQIAKYADEVIKNLPPQIDPITIRKKIAEANNEAYETHSVRRDRWKPMAEILAKQFENEVGREGGLIFHKASSILEDIYTIPPKLREGALETVETISKFAKTAIVTHGNEDWTNFKIDGLGLRESFDKVFIVPEGEHKEKDHWRAAVEYFGIPPKHALVSGDNIKGDIIAASEAGVKNLVWMNFREGWSLYRKGDLPEGTLEISNMIEFIDKMLESWS